MSGMTKNIHILISGRDESLLATRELILEKAGYRVTTTLLPLESVTAASKVRLLLLCHTLSAAERARDLAEIAAAFPNVKTICFRASDSVRKDCDAKIDSHKGPQEMLRVVQLALHDEL